MINMILKPQTVRIMAKHKELVVAFILESAKQEYKIDLSDNKGSIGAVVGGGNKLVRIAETPEGMAFAKVLCDVSIALRDTFSGVSKLRDNLEELQKFRQRQDLTSPSALA